MTLSDNENDTSQKSVSLNNERKLYKDLFKNTNSSSYSENSWKRFFIKRFLIYFAGMLLIDFLMIEYILKFTNINTLFIAGTFQGNTPLIDILLLIQVLFYQYLFRADSFVYIPNNKLVYTFLPTLHFFIFVIITSLTIDFQIFDVLMYILVGSAFIGLVHLVYRLYYMSGFSSSRLQSENNMKINTREFSGGRGYARIGEK